MRDLSSYRDDTMSFFGDIRRSVHHFFNDYMPALRSYPTMDVREEDKRYVVEAEIPGMTEKDIDISVHNDLLSISSRHVEATEEKREGYIMKERKSTAFNRRFTLPDDADKDHIEADYSQGLLTLSIPKIAREKQVKHINVSKPQSAKIEAVAEKAEAAAGKAEAASEEPGMAERAGTAPEKKEKPRKTK